MFIGGIVLLLGAVLVAAVTSMTAMPDPVACTLEAKVCPDGSYVGRTGPHCEFEPCPNDTGTNDPKLMSHETLAQLAGCTDTGMQELNGKMRQTWSCPNLPTGNIGSFAHDIVYYSDGHAYGLGFSALTYNVPYTVDQPVDAIYSDCIQVCTGTRLMAYINGKWESVNSVARMKELTGTIDSEAEALAFARYATGQPTVDEIPLQGLTASVMDKGDGSFDVQLFPHEGGICCGTDYVYYRTTYNVSADGTIKEMGTTQAGTVENHAIA